MAEYINTTTSHTLFIKRLLCPHKMIEHGVLTCKKKIRWWTPRFYKDGEWVCIYHYHCDGKCREEI